VAFAPPSGYETLESDPSQSRQRFPTLSLPPP